MWRTKKFKSAGAMRAWLAEREGRIQFTEIFINNGYAVEWRPFRRIF